MTLSRRQFGTGVTALLIGLPQTGCGGGGDAAPDNAQRSSEPPPAVRQTIATVQVVATKAGTFPYTATVMPLRGRVPTGQALESPDDATLRSSVLTLHDDGSVALAVVSGTLTVAAAGTTNVRLQAGTPSAGTPLTAAAISAVVNEVAVNFAGSYGSATLSSFANPERVWWATPSTICARYRLPAPTPGGSRLEAVIDIQAWAGRAQVEVVVENGRLNAASTTSPSGPSPAAYTGATVRINGTTVATVNSTGPQGAEGNHAAFRAWYAMGWTGEGNPELRATQLHTELQMHPLLFKPARENTLNLFGYATDGYVPWGTGRHRPYGMGAPGDHPSIGLLPQWESHALQTGDVRTWRAVEASTLALLSFNINYRDTTSQLVPSFSQVGRKSMGGSSPIGVVWPATVNNNDAATWEVAHHPAGGLMGFVARPSPVFIEIAQKIALWNGAWSGFGNAVSDPTWQWTAGVHGLYYQLRGKAWAMRSQAHAIAVTPDNMAWKTDAKTALGRNAAVLATWLTDSKAKLNVIWDPAPSAFGGEGLSDADPAVAGFQAKLWQHHYLVQSIHIAASARLLTGTDQDTLARVADWVSLQGVRWVNEQPNGGWRYVPYHTTIGASATALTSANDWGAQMRAAMTGNSSGATGPLMALGGTGTAYSQFEADRAVGANYPSYWWAALVCAVERGVPGASTAWTTVNTNTTNLSVWLAGASTDPRWGSTPRNV